MTVVAQPGSPRWPGSALRARRPRRDPDTRARAARAAFNARTETVRTTRMREVAMRRLALTATVVVTLIVPMTPLASATVDGRNGRIAFREYLNNAHTHGAIFSINPDGGGLRQVTHP